MRLLQPQVVLVKNEDNEKLYASVLDIYRPIIVNKSVSSVPSGLATDEAYATNIFLMRSMQVKLFNIVSLILIRMVRMNF